MQSAWVILEGSYSLSKIDDPKLSIPLYSSSDNYLGPGATGFKSIESPRIDIILLSNESIFHFSTSLLGARFSAMSLFNVRLGIIFPLSLINH